MSDKRKQLTALAVLAFVLFAPTAIQKTVEVASRAYNQLAASAGRTSDGKCIKAVFKGTASTYNPQYEKHESWGLSAGGRYNPNAYEAALQISLARRYRCGYGKGTFCQAVVQAPNGKAMIVRINDNGPLGGSARGAKERVIDLNEKSMRYLSGEKYGRAKGLIKGVTVTLLCDAAGTTLGPLDPAERAAWANRIFNIPNVNVGTRSPSSIYNRFARSSLGRFLGMPQVPQNGGGSGGGSSGGGSGGASGGVSGADSAQGKVADSDLEQAAKAYFANDDGEEDKSDFDSDSSYYDDFGVDGGVDSGGVDDSSSSGETSANNLLTCLPNMVVKNEPALIFWQCADGSDSGTLSANSSRVFKLKAMGKMRVNPVESTDYDLTCGEDSRQGQSSSCHIEVINPAIAMLANAYSVPLWEKVNISWRTLDMSNCVLESDDDNSKYKNWKRRGSNGDALSHPITKRTVFTLTCTTLTGTERAKEIVIGVER